MLHGAFVFLMALAMLAVGNASHDFTWSLTTGIILVAVRAAVRSANAESYEHECEQHEKDMQAIRDASAKVIK